MKSAQDNGTAETRKWRSRPAGIRGGAPSLAALLRRHDRDRYQTALFAPADRREALFALYAFNYEIARVRDAVTQPTLGQIRLQWWREVVEAAYLGAAPRQHEVAGPLALLIREAAPSREYFARLIDARERDLSDEPPVDMAALTEYAAGTSSALLALALEVLDIDDPASRRAARDIGIGYALAGLLRVMPYHAAAGRSYIPADIAARTRLDPDSYARLRGSPALRAAAAELADAALMHLDAARRTAENAPRRARAVLLHAVIARHFLTRLKRAAYDPFAAGLAASDGLQSWRLATVALTGRF